MRYHLTINPTESENFTQLLQKAIDNSNNNKHLIIKNTLTHEDLAALLYLVQKPFLFPFKKLTVHANTKLLQDPNFLKLLKHLNASAPIFEGVELIIDKSDDQNQILQELNTLASDISYPLQILEIDSTGITTPSSLNLDAFRKTIIANIQKKHLESTTHPHPQLKTAAPTDNAFINAQSILSKPIRIKELLRYNQFQINKETPIQIEVEYVEALDHNLSHNLDANAELQAEVQDVQPYLGEKLNFEDFASNPRYQQKVLASLGSILDKELIKDELFKRLSHELFANLPHAIKFISLAAADQLADNLPGLVTFNKDNLPQGYLLKQTELGEWILDFNPAFENTISDDFTPQAHSFLDEIEPIYPIKLDEEQVKAWTRNDPNFAFLFKDYPQLELQLTNLWIKKGDDGVIAFFDKLREAGSPQNLQLLHQSYLKFIPQWDQLDKNASFFESLKQVNNFDSAKKCCFSNFIKDTGSSRFNYGKTIAAFEIFWQKFNDLCVEKHVSPDVIQQFIRSDLRTSWHTAGAPFFGYGGGDPVVYMDRLWCILKNARDLETQLKNFNGLLLDNYGPYYAVLYEHLNEVSVEAIPTYDAELQNKQTFSPDFNLYRVSLDSLMDTLFGERYSYIEDFFKKNQSKTLWLVNREVLNPKKRSKIPQAQFKELFDNGNAIPYTEKAAKPPFDIYQQVGTLYKGKIAFEDLVEYLKYQQLKGNTKLQPLPPAKSSREAFNAVFLKQALRYLSQQTSGISAHDLSTQLNNYELYYKNKDSLDYHLMIFATLFLVSHERSDRNPNLKPLFDATYHSLSEKVLENTIKIFYKLNRQGIKLNEKEGKIILDRMKAMNSSGFESLHLDKEQCIEKLLYSLEHNRFATFKFLDLYNRWDLSSFVFTLDTADFLAKDSQVSQAFGDDLLLFAALINSNEEVFFYDQANKERLKLCATTYKVSKSFELGPAIFHENVYRSLESKAHLRLKQITEVRSVLHKITQLPTPNNYIYAIRLLIDNNCFFSYSSFLSYIQQLEALPQNFDPQAVKTILTQPLWLREGIRKKPPAVFEKLHSDFKHPIIELLIELHKVANHSQNLDAKAEELYYQTLREDLYAQSYLNLLSHLETKWAESGSLLTITSQTALSTIIKQIKDICITTAFKHYDGPLVQQLSLKIADLPEMQDTVTELVNGVEQQVSQLDFARIKEIDNAVTQLANSTAQLLKNPSVIKQNNEFAALFARFDFSKIHFNSLLQLVALLNDMTQRNYLPLLSALLSSPDYTVNSAGMTQLISYLTLLHQNHLPTHYLTVVTSLLVNQPVDEVSGNLLVQQIKEAYTADEHDPVLELAMTRFANNYTQFSQVIGLSHNLELRDKLCALFNALTDEQINEISQKLTELSPDARGKVLDIFAKANSLKRDKQEFNLDIVKLLLNIAALPEDNLNQLHIFFKTTTLNLNTLFEATVVNKLHPGKFSELLNHLGQFRNRNIDKQFDCSQVERVINNAINLNNNTVYPKHYRKQLMEAFLFVNAAGKDLPIYDGKAAKDLTNEQIKTYFKQLKKGSFANTALTPFQKRLVAIALLREAMFRSTGEFPYSTQIIALIDCMLHKGDLITNIDTGQGKSLIDTMKAALLYLDSDRVDLSTSSIVDARRDIANYGSFLRLLGIPFSEKPVTASSDIANFKKKGINFSTFSQLSLFFSKMKALGTAFEKPHYRISLVLNESDFTLLDDRVIHRFASVNGAPVPPGQEWIYYAINRFVAKPGFIHNGNSAKQDITALKAYLLSEARQDMSKKKSIKMMDTFDDAQYLSWIESALIVTQLKENKDYVIPPEPEKRIKDKIVYFSKVVKILTKDGKISLDSVFGNGMQQLLYASLNTLRNSEEFIIEPQNRTILSSNNKNLLTYYLSKIGFIWGSSGSVGSEMEIKEQAQKYRFDFAKLQPHQSPRRTVALTMCEDKASQFETLFAQLTANELNNFSAPHLVFCEDIDAAIEMRNAFITYAQKHDKSAHANHVQLYTGLGKEEDFIKNAAVAGMVTFTTSALGRNTDIPYDKSASGLEIWHTFVDYTRGTIQKSGRTDRQGSGGKVHFVLNKTEMHNKSVEQITDNLESQAAEARKENELLYDVLDYLLAYVESLPDALFSAGKLQFIKETWSKFSAHSENKYKEVKSLAAFDDLFINNSLSYFNKLIRENVNPNPDAIILQHVKSYLNQFAAEAVDEQAPNDVGAVNLEECSTPLTIAYHLLNFDPLSSVSKVTIKEQLLTVFENLSHDSFIPKNVNYLNFLQASPANQKIVVDAHKEFMHEFLTMAASKQSFILRWLGFEGNLNRIASNQHYLVMFQALASVPGTQKLVQPELVRDSIVRLLDEYVEHSWFVNAQRIAEVKKLRSLIEQTSNLHEIMSLLTDSQIASAEHDTKVSRQGGFFRSIKPLNASGHSRFQSTLGHALNLLTSLDSSAELKEEQITKLASFVDKEKPDSGTNKVIVYSLSNARAIIGRKPVEGMTGRPGFFKFNNNVNPNAQPDEDSDLDVDHPSSSCS